MNIRFSEFTSTGSVRKNNQDRVLAVSDGDYGLFVVADGMGGHFGGEIASERLTDELRKWWDSFCKDHKEFEICCEEIKHILADVNESIYSMYSKNGKICGTTVALLFIFKDKYLLLNAGDSRVYSFCKGKIKQESVDHVFSAEEKMKGELTQFEINEHHNKNKLTSAIGCKEKFKMNIRTAPLNNCTFFLCSDGVYKYCNKFSLRYAIKIDSEEKTEQYIKQKVLKGGSGDNFSFIKIIVGKRNNYKGIKIFNMMSWILAIIFLAAFITEKNKLRSFDCDNVEQPVITDIPQKNDDVDYELEYNKKYSLDGKTVIFIDNYGEPEIEVNGRMFKSETFDETYCTETETAVTEKAESEIVSDKETDIDGLSYNTVQAVNGEIPYDEQNDTFETNNAIETVTADTVTLPQISEETTVSYNNDNSDGINSIEKSLSYDLPDNIDTDHEINEVSIR